jgi:Rrf2 family protein
MAESPSTELPSLLNDLSRPGAHRIDTRASIFVCTSDDSLYVALNRMVTGIVPMAAAGFSNRVDGSIFSDPDPIPMLLSRTCEYGVRAMVYLASESPSDYRSVRSISSDLDISFHFLTKIFQQLSRAGLLNSYRGPNGGVMLSRPASEITLKEIVVAIEGPDLFRECVLGLPGCGEARPCPLHDAWKDVRAELGNMLEGRCLDEIGDEVVRGHLRLA